MNRPPLKWGETPLTTLPEIRRDYPLNLSILVSGGKETNQDSLSNGERTGKSPALNPLALVSQREMWGAGPHLGRWPGV